MKNIDLQKDKQITNDFIKLFEELNLSLDEKIKLSEDELIKVNFEIEKFYVEEDIFVGKQEITLTKIKSDDLINRKIHRYSIILGLISNKYQIIKERLKSGFYVDAYELANKKIELFRMQIEINAKEEFLRNYEKRKNIINS